MDGAVGTVTVWCLWGAGAGRLGQEIRILAKRNMINCCNQNMAPRQNKADPITPCQQLNFDCFCFGSRP